MSVKAFLVSRDGTRTETPHGGGLRVIMPWRRRVDGRMFETTFDSVVEDGRDVLLYHEGVTVDRTEAYEKAERENRENLWKFIRRGLGLED